MCLLVIKKLLNNCLNFLMLICFLTEADLVGSSFREVFREVVHVTDTNDEAWLSDADLYSVCKLFSGISVPFGEFSNTWKIMLR